MIDIETMGTSYDAAIVQIGAMAFNIETGEKDKGISINIDLENSVNSGGVIDASTVKWWISQGDDAKRLFSRGDDVRNVLAVFCKYIKDFPVERYWANSPSFDFVILKSTFKRLNIGFPISFYRECDVRTLSALYPEIKKSEPSVGISHTALDDCEFQINYTSKIWQKIKNVKPKCIHDIVWSDMYAAYICKKCGEKLGFKKDWTNE